MAKYGAKYLRWAPFAEETPDESSQDFPKYGSAISLGKLVKVTDAPAFNEGKLYGDDELAEYVSEFKECPVDVEVTELSNATASAIFGAKLATGTGSEKDLEFSGEDNAPYGGLAFFICKIVNNKKLYQGVYYPKLKASMQGEEYATKGDGITLTGGKAKFTASTAANGKWRVKSDDLTTAAAAQAWVDAKLTAAT